MKKNTSSPKKQLIFLKIFKIEHDMGDNFIQKLNLILLKISEIDSKSKLVDFKMFYPPKGLCKADTEGGPIVFTYVLFWVRKRILDFQFTSGFLPF